MVRYIWNGVGLTSPEVWEPAALERDGFLLEEEGRPRCELKWRVVQGTFSFEKHLKRLAKNHKGVTMDGVAVEDTPPSWQASLACLAESGLKHQSFIWKTAAHMGIGAALHNPATGLAALIQFFIEERNDEEVAAQALASFRDHSGGKTIPWQMFGLSARIPAEFVLDTFSFKPGHYLVKYWRPKSARQGNKLPAGKGRGTSLTFERFAPASVLLRSESLHGWLVEHMEDGPTDSIPVDVGVDHVSWQGVIKTSLLRQVLRRTVHTSGHVWTTDVGNAILAVQAKGNIPMPDKSFTDVCASYELV